MKYQSPLMLLAALTLASSSLAQKTPRIQKWELLPGGLAAETKGGIFRTTLGRDAIPPMIARVAELSPFYRKHFQTKLRGKWNFTVLADMEEYNRYAREQTRGRPNVQGQCLHERKEVVVCNHKRYGWDSTLSHEYAHAWYPCQGTIWLREGAISLVEVARPRAGKMEIPVNPPRLRGLRLYQKKGHYLSIEHLLKGAREPDGYGYSYEHGWSLNYYLYRLDAARYRAFLKKVRKKTQRDLSEDVAKAFGKEVAELDRGWKAFVEGLD